MPKASRFTPFRLLAFSDSLSGKALHHRHALIATHLHCQIHATGELVPVDLRLSGSGDFHLSGAREVPARLISRLRKVKNLAAARPAHLTHQVLNTLLGHALAHDHWRLCHRLSGELR